MATSIPDPCPSKATTGEKRVYSLLAERLPDHFCSWYEPLVAGRYPDFTVAAADFGLLMFEVKGWYASQIQKASDQTIELRRFAVGVSNLEGHKHPIRQVRESLFGLIDELAAPEFGILRQSEGEHRGRPAFPCGHGVILTNITRPQLESAGLGRLFPDPSVLCRDELAALEQATPGEVVGRLKRFFPAPFPFATLTTDQMRTLKGALYREVIVKRRPATANSVAPPRAPEPGSVVFDVLDDEQEKAARSMSGGHQIIFGVAGSGKSSLLLARARTLAARKSDSRILVLCYNKILASHLESQVSGGLNAGSIETRTFHSWAARKTGQRKLERESFEDYEQRVIRLILQEASRFGESEKYDAILIDEAHDFHPNWFRCVVGFLKGGDDGDLLIAVDGAQSLYGRDRRFTWSSVGVQARGRSRRLSRNYRNTKQILEFAWQVSQTMEDDTEELECNVRVLPTKASRKGPLPRCRPCVTIGEEHAAVLETVADLLARGLAEKEIAILYARRESDRIQKLYRLLRTLHKVGWVSNEDEPGGGIRSFGEDGIKLLTIHSSKGLEFPAVILTGLDQLPTREGHDEVLESNLLYVGLTRATDHLIVTWARPSAFTDRVRRSNRVEVVSRRATTPSP